MGVRYGTTDVGGLFISVALFFLFFMAWMLSLPFLMRLVRRVRAMRQPDAVSLLARDPRPPVLYLRPFADDDLPDLTLPSYSRETFAFFPQTYEMRLCRLLEALGPVVMIGEPGERVPELGAARLYVPHGEWQAAVEYFFTRAAAVVIVVGESEGVLWEAVNAMQRVSPERLLFSFPFVLRREKRYSWLAYRRMLRSFQYSMDSVREMEAARQRRYQVLRQRVEAALSVRLPASLGGVSFLTFTDGGKPRLLESKQITQKWLFASFTNPTQIDLWRTLEPFLSKHLSRRPT